MTELTERDAEYAFGIVRRICSEIGPGLPGSEGERARAAALKDELVSHLGPENVAFEEFTLAPRAFLGSVPLGALFTAAAVNVEQDPPFLRALGHQFPGELARAVGG